MAMVPVALGLASVLYTFYPPMIGNPFYYIGVVLVVVGSWIWVALMSVNLCAWKRDNPGAPVPLAMFANVAGAYLWGWTAVGAALELLFQILPGRARPDAHDRRRARARLLLLDAARDRLFLADAGLHRLLHDRAARDRRPAVQRFDGRGSPSSCSWSSRCRSASITCSRIRRSAPASSSCIRCSPALVAVPTLLTVFTICASVEIAGRLRGGKGAFGWLDGAAVAQSDHARDRVLVRHARLRRRRRADQHELSARLHHPQHAVDHRPLPPDLRRRDRHHVFRDRLRHVAASDRPRAGQLRPDADRSSGCGSSA